MTLHDKLDIVLKYLSEKKDEGFLYELQILPDIDKNISEEELNTILRFLHSKEFVIDGEILNLDVSVIGYKISVQGQLFLEKTSFKKLKRKEKTEYKKTVAATVLSIVSTIAIISIMVFDAWISWQAYINK
jgi:hypothetical protein